MAKWGHPLLSEKATDSDRSTALGGRGGEATSGSARVAVSLGRQCRRTQAVARWPFMVLCWCLLTIFSKFRMLCLLQKPWASCGWLFPAMMTGSCRQDWSASSHLLLWGFQTQNFHCAALVFPVTQSLGGWIGHRDPWLLGLWWSCRHSDLTCPSLFSGNSHLCFHSTHFMCLKASKAGALGLPPG